MMTSSAFCFALLQNMIHISANIRYPQNSFNTTWRVVVNLTELFLEEIMFVRISPKCMASLKSVIKQKDFIFSLKLFNSHNNNTFVPQLYIFMNSIHLFAKALNMHSLKVWIEIFWG